MRPRTAYDAARSRLLDDLKAAFAEGPFEAAYPGSKAPLSVSIEGDSQKLPFEAIVLALPQSVSNTHRSSGACSAITTDFELVVGLIASGPDDEDASQVLLSYIDCVYQVCMADPTLGGTVDRARPELGVGGGGSDANFGFSYGCQVRIACRRDIPANKAIARALREAG